MKKKNILACIMISCGFAALLFWLFGLVVDTANKFEFMNDYTLYIYYACAILFILYFIVRPFFIIMFAPPYSLDKIYTFNGVEKNKKNYLKMVKVAKRLVSKKLVKEETKEKLLVEVKKTTEEFDIKFDKLKNTINYAVNNDLKSDIRKIIIESARDTMYFTSISQRGMVDVLVVLINNFRLLKKIIKRCGFRPSFLRMIRIYIHVLASCFVAEGAESIDIAGLLGSQVQGLGRHVIGSLVDGLINGYLMLRVGFLTRNLIFESESNSDEINLLKSSFVEAAAALPELTVSAFISPIINVFKGTVITPTKKLVNKVLKNDTPYGEKVK